MRMALTALLGWLLAVPVLADTTAATHSPAWADDVAAFCNQPLISGLLLMAGFICLFPAMATLGTVVLEAMAITCFGLFFGAKMWAGTLGGFPLFIFVFGVALLATEVLLVPGMMKPGALGAISVAAAILMSYSDLHTGLMALTGAVGGGMIGLFAMLKFLPRNKMFRKFLVLEPSPSAASPGSPADLGLPEEGKLGVSSTPLRPAGFAEFDGKKVDVVTEGDFVDRGRYVQVVKVEGKRVVVRPAPAEAWPVSKQANQ